MTNPTITRLETLEKKIDENTKLTQEGFDKMNGRVKTLELTEAKRQGAESVVKRSEIDWQSLFSLALKALAGAIALAYIVVELVVKRLST